MTLTVVVGSSGSGKTTFLNDTTKQHKCTYIRQYHNVRPYITVSKIPNFDPKGLPYWDIYEKEETDKTIKVGGTMAGQFTAGLSGGQRKLLLFELIYQRTMNQEDLLLVFDEPFAGVTDDFVPFIVERLNSMRKKHNILLVTNDHVDELKNLADNTITVSAIDRSHVQVNGLAKVEREKTILALSVGDEYHYQGSSADLKFFLDVEVMGAADLTAVAAFTAFAYTFFVLTFWNSAEESGALVIIAASIIAFFCLNPYLIALTDWRNYMIEEAEALVHASESMNKTLKSLLTLACILIVSLLEYAVVNVVIDGYENPKHWYAMLMDSASLTFPFIFFGLYTSLPFHLVEILASMPFLFMIFFSTTFSPGSGVEVLKELRYLFSRFYWWCMLPQTRDLMDGCPKTEGLNLFFMTLAAILGLSMFLVYEGIMGLRNAAMQKKESARRDHLKDDEFVDLQVELYGEDVLNKDSLAGTNHSRHSRKSSHSSIGKTELEEAAQDDTPADGVVEVAPAPKEATKDDDKIIDESFV